MSTDKPVPSENSLKAKLQLTESQAEAFEAIQEFLDSEEKCFILKGYAGTGKTFLIRLIARFLKMQERQFFLIAPTGRAARILTLKTGFISSTIHSLIYGEVQESIEVSETNSAMSLTFSLKGNQHAPNAVYIVDESSMISDASGSSEYLSFGSGRLLQDFLKHTGILRGTKLKETRRQILFVGDPAQLPPISQFESVALSPQYIKREYDLKTGESILTEVVRHARESDVLALATMFRDAIDTERYDGNVFSRLRAFEIPENTLLKHWQNAVEEYTEEQVIIIVSTNKFAAHYNNVIRRAKYERNHAPLQIGDRLLVTSNNRLFGLLNGDIVEVKDIAPDTETYRYTTSSMTDIVFDYRDVIVSCIDEDGVITEKDVKILENMLWNSSASLSAEERMAIRHIANNVHGINPPLRNPKKKTSDEQKALEQKIKETMQESPYFNPLLVKFGYAITCHKAQGGEWSSVFMDFRSFTRIDSEEYYRWAYTGLTRSKEQLFSMHVPRIPGMYDDEYFD